MAYWARVGGEERAVGVARMAVLSNRHAKEYALYHNERLDQAPRLMLVWLADENTRVVSVQVSHARTAYQNLTNLVRCAAALFLEADQEAPPALVRCIESSEEQIHGAYISSVSEVTAEFWDAHLCYAPFEPIDSPLDFEDHRTFLKLVPRSKGQSRPPPEHFSFGMLAYTRGMHEQARCERFPQTSTSTRCPPDPPASGITASVRRARRSSSTRIVRQTCPTGCASRTPPTKWR